MRAFFNDIKYAIRQLRKSPGFIVIAVISLALAIGANTAVFSFYNSLVLNSLPVKEPQQLHMVNWVGRFSPNIYSGRMTSTPDGQGI